MTQESLSHYRMQVHEQTAEPPRKYESPAGTRVMLRRVGEEGQQAMSAHVSEQMSHQMGQPVRVNVGHEQLTISGTDWGERARETAEAVTEMIRQGSEHPDLGLKMRDLSPFIVGGTMGPSPDEQEPFATIVVGDVGSGIVRTPEEFSAITSGLLTTAFSAAEAQLP